MIKINVLWVHNYTFTNDHKIERFIKYLKYCHTTIRVCANVVLINWVW